MPNRLQLGTCAEAASAIAKVPLLLNWRRSGAVTQSGPVGPEYQKTVCGLAECGTIIGSAFFA
jgi:hypothetical protein